MKSPNKNVGATLAVARVPLAVARAFPAVAGRSRPCLHPRRPLFLAALALAICLATASSANATAPTADSRTLRSMARAYIAFGQYDKAEALAAEAMARARLGADQAELAMCLIDLGTAQQYRDNLDQAAQMLAAGIALQKQAPEKNPYMAYTLRILASVQRRQGRYDDAQATLDEAMALVLADHAADDPALAFFRAEQARLLADQGLLEQACVIHRQALAAVESVYGPGHLCTANLCEEAADLELRHGRLEEAQSLIDRTIRIRQKYQGPAHAASISALFLKARICRAAGDTAASERQIQAALAAASGIRDPVRLARIHEEAARVRTDVQLSRL